MTRSKMIDAKLKTERYHKFIIIYFHLLQNHLEKWLEALQTDIQTRNIDFDKVAENVIAEVSRDDMEKEKEDLYKKKNILLKAIESNKRYEKYQGSTNFI